MLAELMLPERSPLIVQQCLGETRAVRKHKYHLYEGMRGAEFARLMNVICINYERWPVAILV